MMATLSILLAAHRGGYASMNHAFGLALSQGDWGCEIDVALLVADGPTTVAVLIEVKGGNDLVDETDVRNLVHAQGLLRDAGLDALIGMATTRESLSDDEIRLFRGVADDAPERRYGSSLALALPVVLSGPDLSVPWLDPAHPWRWSTPGGIPLDGLLVKGCERNLGFSGYDFADRLQCRWTN
jgi:hypothetical protein